MSRQSPPIHFYRAGLSGRSARPTFSPRLINRFFLRRRNFLGCALDCRLGRRPFCSLRNGSLARSLLNRRARRFPEPAEKRLKRAPQFPQSAPDSLLRRRRTITRGQRPMAGRPRLDQATLVEFAKFFAIHIAKMNLHASKLTDKSCENAVDLGFHEADDLSVYRDIFVAVDLNPHINPQPPCCQILQNLNRRQRNLLPTSNPCRSHPASSRPCACHQRQRHDRRARNQPPRDQPLVTYRIDPETDECHRNSKMPKCQPIRSIGQKRIVPIRNG